MSKSEVSVNMIPGDCFLPDTGMALPIIVFEKEIVVVITPSWAKKYGSANDFMETMEGLMRLNSDTPDGPLFAVSGVLNTKDDVMTLSASYEAFQALYDRAVQQVAA